jgi:cystathionine beta-lyase/cystathionine gamma-synthase
METPDDLCPRPERLELGPTRPHAPPIYLSSVWECDDPEQADAMLGGQMPGYVYARDGHPNADMLAEKCRKLHGADRAIITSSGMSALGLVLLSQLAPGDHVIVSNQLYGRTATLFTKEAARWGVAHSLVDSTDLAQVKAAVARNTKLLVVETISNPLLRVADLAALADIAHAAGAALLADNTFAGPAVCRPMALGAPWVMESLTKSMNGHSDVVLGLVCGSESHWTRVPGALSTWGLNAAPMECWLALRGLGTLAVRAERACQNALAVAESLVGAQGVSAVHYPGLASHPDHELAGRQFAGRFGSMVTFTLTGGEVAAVAFMKAAQQIAFCPSLGELATTLSHPASTSHRGLSPADRAALGITGGTIRLSVGIESCESVVEVVRQGLAAVG